MLTVQYLLQSDQDLFTDMKRNEKNTHSSHARPKTKARGQLVTIADYMCASLEANNNHPMHLHMNYMYNGCTCPIINDQGYNRDNT